MHMRKANSCIRTLAHTFFSDFRNTETFKIIYKIFYQILCEKQLKTRRIGDKLCIQRPFDVT